MHMHIHIHTNIRQGSAMHLFVFTGKTKHFYIQKQRMIKKKFVFNSQLLIRAPVKKETKFKNWCWTDFERKVIEINQERNGC